MLATGKRVEYTGTATLRLVDGRIAEIWDNVDLLALFQQIGARLDRVPQVPDRVVVGARHRWLGKAIGQRARRRLVKIGRGLGEATNRFEDAWSRAHQTAILTNRVRLSDLAGAEGGTRTPDPSLTKRLLYH